MTVLSIPPEKDKRNETPWISNQLIRSECKIIAQSNHPFKLPYTNEEWILGHFSKPEKIEKTIEIVLREKNLYKKNRAYWAKECCYKFDGKISNRMLKMIEKFMISNTIKQIEN